MNDLLSEIYVHLHTLDTKQVNGEYNVSAWKSKGIYNSGLKPSHDLAPIIILGNLKVGNLKMGVINETIICRI